MISIGGKRHSIAILEAESGSDKREGHPRKRRQDEVEADLRRTSVRGRQLEAHDHENRRSVVEAAKTHVGLHSNGSG